VLTITGVSACSEQQSRFYATQVALGLEYMQYMELVYRDLKPENILINVNGYLKVISLFGCCFPRNDPVIQWAHCTLWFVNKKLSYHRETARQLRIGWLTDRAVHWTLLMYNYRLAKVRTPKVESTISAKKASDSNIGGRWNFLTLYKTYVFQGHQSLFVMCDVHRSLILALRSVFVVALTHCVELRTIWRRKLSSARFVWLAWSDWLWFSTESF